MEHYTVMADPGDTVYPTVKQVRDIGEWVNLAQVTSMDYRDPDDQYKLLTGAGMQFALTEASVEEYALTYGHATDDLTIEMRIPGLDQTTCDADAQRDYQMLKLEYGGAVGIFGPVGDKALTVESFRGSGSVGQPDASGNFPVAVA